MALNLDSALHSLHQCAEEQHTDRPLHDRLGQLQLLLADDLAWIEETLLATAAEGARPATDAARHLIGQGGKRIRPIALLLSAACFGAIPPAARELAVVTELVHTATLMHDDVIDDGMERRGAPTARRVWGNAVSVLAGDLMLVHALERTAEQAPEAMGSLVGTLRELVDGEVLQLRGRSRLDVTRDTYERVLRGKTASLFRWATGAGASLGGADAEQRESLAGFGELLGMAFQLVDDVLDYTSDRTRKTALADLREGKLTLPLVLAVEQSPELLEPVRRIHSGDDGPIADVSRSVVESGACERVRARATEHTTRAVELLQHLPGSQARSLLESVAFQLVRRTS